MTDDSTAGASADGSIMERLEAATQAAREGKFEEALFVLEQVLIEDPAHVAALEQVAEHELELNRLDRAEAAASQAIALDPVSATGLSVLGQIRTEKEQWSDAIDLLQRANKIRGNDPDILRRLGWALFHGGQKPQGVVTLERALNLDSDNTLVLCDLGVVYLELKNFAKSKALFARVLQLDPGNIRAEECLVAVERLEKLGG